MNEFLYGFLTWFKAFFGNMLDGLLMVCQGVIFGIAKIFNIPYYFKLWSDERANFGLFDWIFSVLAFVLAFAVWAGVIALLILGIRKYLRFRRTIVGNEDLLEEISDLHREVVRLTADKERLMELKVAQAGVPLEFPRQTYEGEAVEADNTQADSPRPETAGVVAGAAGQSTENAPALPCRFSRLHMVDEKYTSYEAPVYEDGMTLGQICEDLRNFACSRHALYYDLRTIWLTLAGFACTKLLILQGISGTGKTSLPYVMGKYFRNDATIASVQPSWRDRNELFGYFNEFTKKFNETDVLRRIYEAGYNDDLNVIILDEMNIARVEYYFAEMLSILEMPDPREWKIELVPSVWESDPARLTDGFLRIPQNVWYIGTINNDDSTFSVSDKVYDRAFVINLDTKGIPFEAPATESKRISYSHVADLYEKAKRDFPVTQEILDKIEKLDLYVIEKFRIAFGNRILKQLKNFVPVYVACGGTEMEAIDYIFVTKVFRKFESLNLSLIRDEIRGLIAFMDVQFGKGSMKESIAYLQRLQKMY